MELLPLRFWQGQKESNPQPTVLETATLPVELYPYERKAKKSILAFHKNQRLPILPGGLPPSTFGVCRLNGCVRYGNRWTPAAIATESSELCALTTTENVSPLSALSLKLSPRPISTGPLHASLHFHSRPIYHVVFMGPYLSCKEKPHL